MSIRRRDLSVAHFDEYESDLAVEFSVRLFDLRTVVDRKLIAIKLLTIDSVSLRQLLK